MDISHTKFAQETHLKKGKCSTLLDHLTNDINGSSFEPLLNMVNKFVANMNLARWVLFLKPSFLQITVYI